MNSIPEIINIYNKYKGDGLSVMGVATAFEDYNKEKLLENGDKWETALAENIKADAPFN